MRAAFAVVLAVALVPLAGCMSGSQTSSNSEDSWSYSSGGQGNADQTGSVHSETGHVSAHLSVGGQASIHLIVKDETGDTVIRMECSGSGGCSKTRETNHDDPGRWDIALEGIYNGGVSASVTAR